MEETVTVFDWNFVYGIIIGAFVAGFAVYFWLKRDSINLKPRGKKTKKIHSEDEVPDVEWADAKYTKPEETEGQTKAKVGFRPPTAKFKNDSW